MQTSYKMNQNNNENNQKRGCTIPLTGCLWPIIMFFGAGAMFYQYRVYKTQYEQEQIKLEQLKQDFAAKQDSAKTLVLDTLNTKKQK